MRDWLRDARLAAGKSQKQLAGELKITESYYFYIERGLRQKKMDITLAWKLSKALGMSIDEIAEHENKS